MHGDNSTWIATYTGRQFWPLDPRPEDVCIEDIAHALALKCRFGGHCKCYYSVAQHSVLGSLIISDKNALWFLLHDAAEAYMFDACRPIKKEFPFIREIEDRLMVCICDKFGLPHEMPEEVNHMDNQLLVTEIRDIMETPTVKWYDYGADPLSSKIHSWDWRLAKDNFLNTFNLITGDKS